MKFKFKATRVSTGEVYEGIADAIDKFALAKNLKSEGSVVLTASPINEKAFSANALVLNLFAHISLKERIFFANNLSEMISAGLPLTRALSVLERQSVNQEYRRVITSIINEVTSGGSLSTALARFPKVFSPIFIAMVESGEKSGRLPESLKIVAEQMQKQYALRKKVRGALIYPAIIITAMLGIAILMMIFVVPTLAETFADIGADLPASTQLLINTSTFLSEHGFLALMAFVIFVFVSLRLVRSARGQRIWSWTLLRLPIFKGIVQGLNSAVTARTMSSLLSSGVDMVEAIKITQKVIQNTYYQEVLSRAAEEVPKGKSLSAIFAEVPKLYPVFVTEMLDVGEETGKLSDMMMKLAIFYENEVDSITKDMSTIIEPIIMILVGTGVAFFALSMIQPIYSIGDKL